MSSPNGTQAIDRAAMLLAQVVHGSEPASFTELTAACGLAKSTTSRLLTALERHQLVRRDGDGRFWPGELFVRYAWRGTAGTDLVAVAQPFLARLGEQTSETINLGIAVGAADGASRAGRDTAAGPASSGVAARAGGGGAGSGGGGAADGSVDYMIVQQIAQVDSRYMIGGTNWVGLAVPLHCSALGKVLLAWSEPDVVARVIRERGLKPLTDRTIHGSADLHAALAKIRSQGFALDDEESAPGLRCVAAPIWDGSGCVAAALSLSSPADRLSLHDALRLAPQMIESANAVSRRLGWFGDSSIESGSASDAVIHSGR